MRYTVDSSAPDRKKESRRKTFPSMAGGLIDCGLCLQPLLSSPDPRRVRVEGALRFLSALFVQPIALEVALRVLSASNAGRRALLNARQTQEQAEEYWREHLPGPAGLLCAAVAGLSCLGLIVAGPVIGLRVVILRIAGRRRADPRAVTQGRADRKVRGTGHRHIRSTWAPERNDPADPLR